MSSENEKIKVTVEYDRPNWESVYLSIRENVDEDTGRTKMIIHKGEKSFIIYIEARDTVGVRAALGSIAKWIDVADVINREI